MRKTTLRGEGLWGDWQQQRAKKQRQAEEKGQEVKQRSYEGEEENQERREGANMYMEDPRNGRKGLGKGRMIHKKGRMGPIKWSIDPRK